MIRLVESLEKLFRLLAVIIFGPRGTWGADVLAPVVFALMGPPDRGSHIFMYIMKAESDRSACCMKTSEEVAVCIYGATSERAVRQGECETAKPWLMAIM